MATRPLVLVCDRDGRTARMLARMLRDDGMDAEVATSSEAAIVRLGQGPAPDILVTDLGAPHADGAAVARYARSVQPGLPIFVIASHPQLAVTLAATLAPAAVVLEKPLDYERLSRGIARALTPGLGGDSTPPPPSWGL